MVVTDPGCALPVAVHKKPPDLGLSRARPSCLPMFAVAPKCIDRGSSRGRNWPMVPCGNAAGHWAEEERDTPWTEHPGDQRRTYDPDRSFAPAWPLCAGQPSLGSAWWGSLNGHNGSVRDAAEFASRQTLRRPSALQRTEASLGVCGDSVHCAVALEPAPVRAQHNWHAVCFRHH
jgi:hypothetical protein